MNLDTIEEALKVNVVFLINDLMLKEKASNVSKKDFTNSVAALEIVKVSESHLKLNVFKNFRN